MRYSRVLPIAIAATAVFCVRAAHAQESAENLIKKGDVHYARLDPDDALKFYLPAEKLTPNDATLLVRIARQYRHLVSESTNEADKERYAKLATSYADRAAALAPNNSEAQLAVAISYGKVQPYQSTGEKLATSRTIKTAAEKSIQLDPRNDLAWQVLGKYYFAFADVSSVKRALAQVKYGKLPAATFQDAARCFEKALALNPHRLMHYIELGRTYVKMDRNAEAKQLIAKGLAMPETEKDDPETKRMGRELLKGL